MVYGRGPFHEKSSICRAAVMSGIVNDATGGFMILSYADSQSVFEGFNKNDVESANYMGEEGDLEFLIFRPESSCP